jgi:hypothetical protein
MNEPKVDLNEYLGEGGWERYLELEDQEMLATFRYMADEDPQIMAAFANNYGEVVFNNNSDYKEELLEAGNDPVKRAYVHFNYEMNAYPNSG